ncbi:unnamed protein product [Trichogramma brassicae]|uniref:Uncharacterized protein n=1 Tax=Trichogramma brassicae TaxID=86971 RepID=A0A6H5IWL0_9HYME|nr:unnamed protein product [Trichogramma brassicae]
MTRYWLNVTFIRIIYPAILVACTVWRPVGLSLVYLGLALVSPMVPVPTAKSMKGHTGRYLKAAIALSFILVMLQAAFQIVLASLPPYGYFLENCEFTETLLRHVGLVRLNQASAWEILFWLTPEIVVFPVTLTIYCLCRRLTLSPVQGDENVTATVEQYERRSKERSAKIINFLGTIGTYIVLAVLCCAAALKPSVEGAFYFLVFLGSATWWACHRELRRGFAVVVRVLMVVVALHILVLLSYQNQWPQEYLPSNGTWARYFGLVAVYQTNCSDPRNVDYIDSADWSTYAYSLRMFLLYFVLALQSKFLFRKPNRNEIAALGTPDERTPTWSIMYHSWTTFALLIWALILWMVPNKRASMMSCSPFIVFYSTLLILVQYVYSMDLTEDELPTVIHGINMADIGFKKTNELGCWHIVVKCLFMTMFWITMRQYTAEKMRQRSSSTLRDMVAPLHVSVTTATMSNQQQQQEQDSLPEIRSKFMKNVGKMVKKFLTKYWTAVLAIMLFTSGITGERMTVFRIIYMSLFLFFIISFQVCAINFFFVLTIAVAINLRRSTQILVINTLATAVAVLMVIKMLYQIDYIKHKDWDRNCTEYMPGNSTSNETIVTKTYNMAEWIGFQKVSQEIKLPKLLEGYIGVIVVTTARSIIGIRQMFYRQKHNEPPETPLVMFPNIKRADADRGIDFCLKFLLNYGFYKFGFEFCLLGMVALIGTRLDFYSLFYSVWLMILFSLHRKTVSRLWPILKVFAIVLLPFQYALVVAPPTWLCINYPWSDSDILRGLQEWMFLPDLDSRPNSKKLICDFILLYMVVRQSLVFRIEARHDNSGQEFVAAHNYSVYKDMDNPNFVNPVKDYVSQIHNYLDVIKRGGMMSLMWFTLSIMFMAGTNRTNLFSLGYLIGAFVFLWQGSDFYLRPVKIILKWWNILLGYNVFVIFCKTIFQGIGCVFIQNLETHACWVIQLLGIACLKKFELSAEQFKSSSVCEVDREDIGMVWDGVCFGFLLFQKRLFRSYYFFHIVDETKAMSILASRGAELLEELHQKRIGEQENVEKAILQKIKFKMDKIKANQRKIQGPNYKEPKIHKVAIRSGDYYMFDHMDDDDDLTDFYPERSGSEDDRTDNQQRRMTVSQLPEQDTVSSGDDGDDDTDRELVDELDKSSIKETDKAKKKGAKVSFLTYFKFVWAFLNSIMVSMTKHLNRYSNDYRYVRKVLAKEKKILKAKPDFRMGTRLGINKIWQPLPIVRQGKDNALALPHIRILAPSMERGLDMSSSSTITYPKTEEEEVELSEKDQPPIIQLAQSIWFGILAHSTFFCYFMVFLHQIKNASLLSTPLPLMVFLWGSLTIPRPSKTFWITLIAYIEVIVIVKCICQPAILSWNKKELSSYPFEIPRIFGVERKPNYALWDLLLLLVVFFHRFMLKSLGQWTSPTSTRLRKYPAGLTLATVRQAGGDADNESVSKVATNEPNSGASSIIDKSDSQSVEVTTPKGRVLKLYPRGEGDEPNLPPNIDNEELVVIEAVERNVLDESLKNAVCLSLNAHFEPIKAFFHSILDPQGKEKTNVYAYMFFCDFFNFLLLIFGFSSFGAQQGDGGVTEYLSENRVPLPFLLMLLLQFALIVIDRALFLKKSIQGKLIFQYFLVIGIHIWMFIILPSATERQFNTKLIPQIWYMVKCFYLLLAAYQLRLGYPTRILGNFLCKKYSIVNYTLFKGFMVVPFLFEMRAVMDWIWTDTSMTAMDWFKMEDIFANIYQIKVIFTIINLLKNINNQIKKLQCMRGLENDYPQERGVKKTQWSKYLIGGGALFLMIGMIWFPLLLFALGSKVGIANIPQEVTLNLRIGSYEPIYVLSAQNNSIFEYSQQNYDDLREMYEVMHRDRSAVTFLENYQNTDVTAIKFTRANLEAESSASNDLYLYRDVVLLVENNTLNQQWFSVSEPCNDTIYNRTLNEIPLNDCSYIMMYFFNDKMFPEGLSFISGLGIFGLYTTAVILVSSFIKRMVSDMAPKIMFEDLPYVDRILRLCLDIYLVRESGDLCLEEDLFAKLVFLYRSPETLIRYESQIFFLNSIKIEILFRRWTRSPEPGEQPDENDEENYNEIDDRGSNPDEPDEPDQPRRRV